MSLPTIDRIEFAASDIAHECDGPVTKFVAISRACKLAAGRKYDAETIANALSDVLAGIDGDRS